jgi:KDO2-lipid IV(A) lauroyltransferase
MRDKPAAKEWQIAMVLRILLALGRLPLSVGQALGHLLGRWIYSVDRRHRSIVKKNLRRVYGDGLDERRMDCLAREVFHHLGQIPFELCWSLHLKSDDVTNYFEISGVQNYVKAIEKGYGTLILTAHFGNWELMPIIGHLLKMPLNIVFRRMDSPLLDQVIERIRGRYGAKLICNRKNASQIMRALKRNEAVAMLMDQNVDWYEGVFVDFLGQKACTSKGMAALARLTKSPVVPVFLVRDVRKFRVFIMPAFDFQETSDKIGDIKNATQAYNDVIGSFVKQHPEQWFWVHQRWKTKPYHPWPRNQITG